MDNNAVGFKEYKGTKESLLSNTNIKDGDIVFGYDETSDTSYIYHNGVFYGDTSELSEVLPEIYIGDAPPLEESSAVVWYQTNVDIPDSPTEEVSWEDINNKPDFAKVATTGDFNDLVNIPDFNLTKESCTVYSYTYEESSYAPFTPEQRESNADAFIKIRQALSDKKDINITVIVVYESKENIEYRDCYITGTTYTSIESGGSISSILTSVSIESATIIQDINKPYLSHVKIDRFGNDAEYPESAGSVKATVTNTYLATDKDLDKHTTTYIGTNAPTNSKYNLWVDTSTEEVVFKYKEGNEWKVLSTGGNGSIEVDTLLDPTSENPIANKAVYAMAVSVEEGFSEIDENLSKKANTENGLVEGRGFKVTDTIKYYLPNTAGKVEGVENTNILVTKAEVLSNEVIDNKATVYNLYAMDELTAEQLAANEAALVSVQNREVAIYKVYTDDDTYAIADVKIVDGPYLEAYVYVSNPNEESKQATITKYTYTFTQAGEYTTSDKEEIVVPSIAKVNELISSGGTGGSGGGLELRELKMSGSADDNAYNLETLELIKENKVIPAIKAGDSTLTPITHNGYNHFSLLVVEMGIEVCMSFTMGEDGSITMSEDTLAPYVLNSPSKVLEWLTKSKALTQVGMHEPVYVIYNALLCLVDCIEAGGTGSTRAVVQFNYGSQRFERVYNATTGEEISTTEIPLGGGGGTAAEGVKMYKVYQNPKDADELAANKAAYDAIAAGEDAIYQMNWIIGWITATYALTMMDICGLAFGLTAPADDGSCVQSGNVSLLINSDGSILSFEEKQVYAPSTEKVEEMIANVGGGGGGENNSNSKNIYNIYCALSEDEEEKAKQLESNVIAYNACMNNEDALYTIFLEYGLSTITSVGIPVEEGVEFIGDLVLASAVLSFLLTLYADGTFDIEEYNFNLSSSGVQVCFLDTTTTEKTIEGVSKIIEYISAGKGVTVVWYRGKDYITTCSDVSILSSTSIALAIQESGAYATYTINNTGEITQFLKVGALLLNHSTVENEKNKEVIGPLSILLSSYGGLTGGLSLSILHKPNYYQVLHTKQVDDSYKMKVILDDNSFGTYTLQSNGILTLDS